MKKRTGDKLDLGQFFLQDKTIIQKLVEAALINKKEVVVEIGAGDGRITKLLAQKAGKVIALEIDKKFLPQLKKLPGKVEIRIEDALGFLQNQSSRKIDKLVANLPSSLVEPVFKTLTQTDFVRAAFLVPQKFTRKLKNQPVFQAYFEIELIEKVSKKAFFPVPKTNWQMIAVEKIPEPLKSGKQELFLLRFIYEHPKAKLKNSLIEAIINIFAHKGKKLTKNQARKILKKAKINPEILEGLPENASVFLDSIKKLSRLI